MSACKCSPCGREFTGLSAFDRHQDVDYTRRPAVVCLNPEARGLVQQSSGRWGFPIDAGSRERLANLRANQPLAHTSGTPQGAETRTAP